MRAQSRLLSATVVAVFLLMPACHGAARRSQSALATATAVEQMRADLAHLAGPTFEGRGTGTPGNDSAAKFIAQRYTALKLVSVAQPGRPACAKGGATSKAECFLLPFTASVAVRNSAPRRIESQNIAAIVRGSGPLADEWVIVGAHFDHLGRDSTNARDPQMGRAIRFGADDNGSGTVTVMELARRLARQPTNRSILIANFSGEELGLLGSKQIAANLPVPKEKVQGMVNFDMVGRLKNDRLIVYGVATASEMRGIVDSANVAPRLTLSAVADGDGPSDHAAFYEGGLPVLHFFTDLHEDYHTSADVAEKINYDGMLRVADYAERVVRALADRPGRLTFQRVQTASANRPSARQGSGVYLGSVPDMGAADVKGMQLSGVRPGSPAEQGGLKAGDIIIKFGDKVVTNIYDYTDALAAYKPDDLVDVVVKRGGAEVTLKVKLGRRQ